MTNFEWLLENKKELIKSLIMGETLAKQLDRATTCSAISCGNCDWFDECDGLSGYHLRKWLDDKHKEPSPYADWEIDDKIEVSNNGKTWYKAHFAGVDENNKPTIWFYKGTSWSCSEDGKEAYNYARKVEE